MFLYVYMCMCIYIYTYIYVHKYISTYMLPFKGMPRTVEVQMASIAEMACNSQADGATGRSK